MNKISIRFYNDREVRAIWDDNDSRWYYSATDVVRAINNETDYVKAGNYWRWLKKKLAAQGVQPVSDTHEFKLVGPDGKKRVADVMDDNGRSTRIWLDLMLKRSLKRCVDWSKMDKNDYLNAMRMSVSDDTEIRRLLKGALTDEIDSREMFMKGIDYSYYYEQED